MTDAEALDAICVNGGLSAEGLNTLHACRAGHPWNNPRQWRNAAFILGGRYLPGLHDEVRHVERQARREGAT